MNDDKIKGAIDDAAGRAKRQVGKWTGNTQTQAEGAAQQLKGKAEKVVGDVRDAIKSATDRPSAERDKELDDKRNRQKRP